MNRSDTSSLSRRNILRAVTSCFALGGISSVVGAESSSRNEPALKKGAVILFQGDSITDEGRKYDVLGPNDNKGLGNGYAAMISGQLLLAHPGSELKCYNRGISGNKIPDLAARWQQDAVALKPDILSIMIGVNDLWHTLAFGKKYKGTIKDYEAGYRTLIERSQNDIPGVRVVICEPFTTRTSDEFKLLGMYRDVARKLADEMKLTFIPFQSLFDKASKSAPAEFWLWDGIHPSAAGHAIMANQWREVVGI
jgi:lysophospholipase L1-like esterase